MTTIHEIIDYTDQLLNVAEIKDYCPNGLQIEGAREVRRVISGVTASQRWIDAAIAADGDLLLVHHGLFWRGDPQPLVGYRGRRVASVIRAGAHLAGYHLPLDSHPELGNNARLAQLFGWEIDGTGPMVGLHGHLAEPQPLDQLAATVGERLGRAPLVIPAGEGLIRRIAWCSGGAQDALEEAAALGVDAYLSGEISEQTVHLARELGVGYIAAGHHATERYGVQALGDRIAQHFDLYHQYIDDDSPA